MTRVYLDHNATTPLRSEARIAMLNAMDVVGKDVLQKQLLKKLVGKLQKLLELQVQTSFSHQAPQSLRHWPVRVEIYTVH
jgi:hypothetical protein